MAENPYLIPGTDCLKNKLGITDAKKLAIVETKITGRLLASLKINPLPGKLDYQYLKQIHSTLFKDLFEWAGTERTVQTMKGITRFEWPDNIKKEADKLFAELNEEKHLKDLERPEFIERAAHYFSELNVIHPFAEGNGRAQRGLFDKLAMDAGFEFNWGRTTKDQLIEAVVYAFARDNSMLEAVFEQTLFERDRGMEVSRSVAIDFNITNPIIQSEYEIAKSIVAEQRKSVENELYPRANIDQALDDIKSVSVNREIKKREPEAFNTVKTFEAYKLLNTLVSQLQTIDGDLLEARNNADINKEKRLLRNKSSVLNKLINRKSIAQKFSSFQRNQLKHEKGLTDKVLSLHRSRGLER